MARVLVFDMGGVLYDFRGDRLIAQTSRRVRRWRSEEVQRVWVPLVQGFERGACSEARFAETVVQYFDLALAPADFLVSFRAAAAGFYEGALELMSELAAHHRLVSLSNTNGVQWPKLLEDFGGQDHFTRTILRTYPASTSLISAPSSALARRTRSERSTTSSTTAETTWPQPNDTAGTLTASMA